MRTTGIKEAILQAKKYSGHLCLDVDGTIFFHKTSDDGKMALFTPVWMPQNCIWSDFHKAVAYYSQKRRLKHCIQECLLRAEQLKNTRGY